MLQRVETKTALTTTAAVYEYSIVHRFAAAETRYGRVRERCALFYEVPNMMKLYIPHPKPMILRKLNRKHEAKNQMA